MGANTVQTNAVDVFLGGACNPTTWRFDTAIPALIEANVTFYNPQVDGWSPELVAVEAQAKTEARLLLFVIDGQTRALASAVEVFEAILNRRNVVVVINDMADGTVIEHKGEKHTVTGRELDDLNRFRAYLRETLKNRDGVTVCATIEDAVQAVIDQVK